MNPHLFPSSLRATAVAACMALGLNASAQVAVEEQSEKTYLRIDLARFQTLDSLAILPNTQDTIYLPPYAYFELADSLSESLVNTDQIIQSAVEIGLDANASDGAGPGTLTLRENNLRIRFEDTSTSGSFPSNDWEITANHSANGGSNFLAFFDVTNNRLPFIVEAAAPDSALYISADGIVNAPHGLAFADGSGVPNLASLDASTPVGTMLYWDGSAWVAIAAGNEGESLNFCNGAPQWGACN